MDTIVTSPRLEMRDREIKNTRIVFRSAKQNDDVLVRCTLSGCELVLDEPCWTSFLSCEFDGCAVVANKECAQMWRGNRWLNCTFIGDFAMGFGQRGDYCPFPLGNLVVDCDFTQTICDITLFEADLPTIKFPRWPNITILEPAKHKTELQSIQFSKILEGWWFLESRNTHPTYSSRSFNWDKLVQRKREFKDNPKDFAPYTDEVRSKLGALPYVIL